MYNLVLDFIESKLEVFERPVIEISDEFSYGPESRKIYVPENKTFTLEEKAWWKRFMMKYLATEYGLYLSVSDDYIFSLLHEIGHYITLEGIPTDIIYNKYNEAYRKMNQTKNAYDYEVQYRQISIERMADLWAIDFIQQFPEVLSVCKEALQY